MIIERPRSTINLFNIYYEMISYVVYPPLLSTENEEGAGNYIVHQL